ncbi:hypothetical protein WJX75_005236 [Coccomyxa subellipsoidea]|uniref:EF-hand domain-containing protein n=1 Tax=Coccomyxa subellipsoidea TaxID=248742 RepID=A0ABR2Z3Q4_9CHLO
MRANYANNSQIVDGVCVGLEEVPQTLRVPSNLDRIPHPELPHATRAVSAEKPHGADTANNRTVLQQHVDFFDSDNDGKIFPQDTYAGFRRMGFNILISMYAVVVIHGTLAYPTHSSWIPDPRLPILTRNIHKCHHGSDSMVYDKEGRFMPEKFEEIFTQHDRDNKGGLSLRDILRLWNSHRDAYDLFGWSAEFLEWLALYLAARNEQGFVPKEAVRGQYDGSLFYQLARKQDAARKDTREKRT